MKPPKPPKAVTLAIFTTMTIILWVFFSVYRQLTSPPEAPVPLEILAPLNPELNTQTLEKLPSRLYFSEQERVEFRDSDFLNNEETEDESDEETILPTPTPIADELNIETESESQTEEGTLIESTPTQAPF